MTQVKVLMMVAVVLTTAWAAPFAVAADSSKLKSFPVAGHGDLQLSVPAGWKDSVQPSPQPGLPPAIELTTDGKKFTVLVSVIPAPSGVRKIDAAKVRKFAEAQGQQMLASAKEQAIVLEEIKGTDTTGYFYTLTDKAPAPGSFEHVTAGFVSVGDLLLTVTILHHEKAASERQLALDMFKTVSQKAAANAVAEGAGLRIAAPGGAWELVIPGKGLKVADDQADPSHKARQLTAEDKETGLVVSVFMEPARKAGDGKIVRDVYWGRAKTSPLKKEGIKLDAAGDFATVQYIVPDVEGVKLNQKNVNLYASHEGVWVDVHISKTEFTDKDQAAIDRIVKDVKFAKLAAEHR